MRKGQIVKITWRDICCHLGVDQPQRTIEAVAVGKVVSQDKKEVCISSGWYTDGSEWPAMDTISMPKGCIDKVEVREINK